MVTSPLIRFRRPIRACPRRHPYLQSPYNASGPDLRRLDNGHTASPICSRIPRYEPLAGTVGAALFDSRGKCGIIVDGHHVASGRLLLALRSPRRSASACHRRDAGRRRGEKAVQPHGRPITVEAALR